MNKKVTITYYLSQEGQKESIRRGGNGMKEQISEVELTPELLEVSSVLPDGEVIFLMGFFDSPQTLGQLIAWKKNCIRETEEARKKAKEEYEEALKKQQAAFVGPKSRLSIFDYWMGRF
jgi:hypothetical protein